MIRRVLLLAFWVFPLLMTSCQFGKLTTETQGVSRARENARTAWWRQLNDPSIDRDIEAGLAASPDLRTVALRVEQAEAAVAGARAASLPRVNLGFGFRDGRRQAIDFGPYDFGPWTSEARLSWELDLSGKLRAARQSAEQSREAAGWDYELARLLLASQIASARMNLYRYEAEGRELKKSLSAGRKTLAFLEEQSQAGLLADPAGDRQQAEVERLRRLGLELERLRDVTLLQLRTLRGGSPPASSERAHFPEPDDWVERPLNELLASHPKLLAQTARVRAALRLEQSARLDLLPTLTVGAMASGRQMGLVDRFMVWAGEVGPSLEIPVYDPRRLARVEGRKSAARVAAAQYRQAVLEVLEDLDAARTNLGSARLQLDAADREIGALARTKEQAREQFTSGLISEVEFLEVERRWLEARRARAALKQRLLTARIDLIKASGGGHPEK